MEQDLAHADDATLMAAVRQGRHEVYGLLYSRHAPVVSNYARRLVRSAEDARDVVAEAFARLFGMLRRGLGPVDEFVPYLMRTVRNVAYDRCRSERLLEYTDQMSVLESVVPFRDLVVEGVERALVATAFRSLPPRWQQVLWLTCVEGRTIDDASEALGVNANALTSLAYRAREGLRQAYLQANVPADVKPRCAPYSAKLGSLARGALGPTPRLRVERHLLECPSCSRHLTELRDLNTTLRDQLIGPVRGSVTAAERLQQGVSVLIREAGVDSDWSSSRVA